MARRGKKQQGDGLGVLLLIVLLVVLVVMLILLVPTIITYTLYSMYKKIPKGFRGKTICYVSMLFTGVILYLAGGVIILDLWNALKGEGDAISFVTAKETWTPMVIAVSSCIPLYLTFALGMVRFSAHKREFLFEQEKLRQEELAFQEKQRQGKALYEQELGKAIIDKRLDEQEIQHLNGIIEEYSIPPGFLSTMHKEVYMDILLETSNDLKVDENEIALLKELSMGLGIGDAVDASTQEYTSKVNTANDIISGSMKPVAPPKNIIMQEGEACYFYEKSELYENRDVSLFDNMEVDIDNYMPQMNFKRHSGNRVSYRDMSSFGSGMLIITDQRVIFIGSNEIREFPLSYVMGMDVSYDSMQIIRKRKPKNREVFKLGVLDKEIAVVLLLRLLNQ